MDTVCRLKATALERFETARLISREMFSGLHRRVETADRQLEHGASNSENQLRFGAAKQKCSNGPPITITEHSGRSSYIVRCAIDLIYNTFAPLLERTNLHILDLSQKLLKGDWTHLTEN